MATASDFIKGALRLLGVVSSGGSPTSAETADGLLVLNEFIDSLSGSRLILHSTQTQTFTWTAGNASRTLGPAGNFVGTRPIQIDPATYVVDTTNNITIPIDFISADRYGAIQDKALSTNYPNCVWVNMTMPEITLTVYPVPTVDLQWNFVSPIPLTQPALSSTTITVPPIYARFFRYNLAVCLSSEFGIEAPPTVQRIAASTSRAIKRMNKLNLESVPNVPTDGRRADIIAGY